MSIDGDRVSKTLLSKFPYPDAYYLIAVDHKVVKYDCETTYCFESHSYTDVVYVGTGSDTGRSITSVEEDRAKVGNHSSRPITLVKQRQQK